MTPEELAAHEARHQPTRRGAVCRTCEGLWPCPSQRTSSALREAWAEVARLRDWKAEALTVLADWERADVARDRIQPPKAWGIDPGEVE